jgi:hypothetical protein
MRKHYIGATYDLTQENMNQLIDQLEHAQKLTEETLNENIELRTKFSQRYEEARGLPISKETILNLIAEILELRALVNELRQENLETGI